MNKSDSQLKKDIETELSWDPKVNAAKIGVTDVAWPKQYRSAKQQLERNLERERAMQAQGAGLSALEQANRALGV